jgi:hypothetical protein
MQIQTSSFNIYISNVNRLYICTTIRINVTKAKATNAQAEKARHNGNNTSKASHDKSEYMCTPKHIWQVLFLRVDVEGTNPLHPQRAWGAKEGQDLCASVKSGTALHSPNGTLQGETGKAVEGRFKRP